MVQETVAWGCFLSRTSIQLLHCLVPLQIVIIATNVIANYLKLMVMSSTYMYLPTVVQICMWAGVWSGPCSCLRVRQWWGGASLQLVCCEQLPVARWRRGETGWGTKSWWTWRCLIKLDNNVHWMMKILKCQDTTQKSPGSLVRCFIRILHDF